MAARWTSDQDQILRRLYDHGHALRGIAAQVGRSELAVAERRRTLAIPARPRSRPWSPPEDELLRAGSATGLPAAAFAAPLRRPAEQVRRRRRALVGSGTAPVGYSAAEDRAIVACWRGAGDVDALAHELGRSAASLRLRAQKLRIHQPAPRRRWQPHEDAAVRDGYESGLNCGQIATELAGRTEAAVAARAGKLGLTTYARLWTSRDDRVLRQLSRDGTELERAAPVLARTPEALRARARKLGIAPLRSRRADRTGRPWTRADDELLELHAGLNPALLAELLSRTPEAITQRLRRLGLREGAQRSPHHPVPGRGELTPGERATAARELRIGGRRRHLALARRLGVRLADIERMRDRATTTSDA